MTRVIAELKAVARGRRHRNPAPDVTDEHRPRQGSGGTTFLTIVLVVVVLYFARVVCIPLALAVLLSFLLAPLVIRLRHWGLPRGISVAIVVLFAFIVVAVVGALMTFQAGELAHKLPEYQQNVREKLQSIRTSGNGLINRATHLLNSFTAELSPSSASRPTPQPAEEKPLPVEIRKTPFAPLEAAQKILGPVLNVFLMAGIVIVFVIFMLLQREDLRDRLIRLVGSGKVNLTTQALDDAGDRLGRYLLAQLFINIIYGVLVGIGLYFIGVPNPVLWGTLATLLRYIPYLGIWLAALMPAAVAFAVEPGWIRLPIVFGMYFGVDLLMYNIAEPMLYGTSTGVSPMAILVAAVFWTWLWGPVGLLLATPLTVCVVVIGRYVPNLEFLSVMLSDEPVLKPETRFYQRLLAMDLEEATEIAEDYLKGRSLEDLYDRVVVPALTLAETDRHRGKLDEHREKFVIQNARILIEDTAERADELVTGNHSKKTGPNGKQSERSLAEQAAAPPAILCIPARDEADEIAALMVAQLLKQRGIVAQSLSAEALASECIRMVGESQTRIACITAVPPLGYTHARYLCRRLRDEFPDLKIVAAILTEQPVDTLRKRKPPVVADELAASVKETLAALLSFVPDRSKEASKPLAHAA